MSIPNSVTSLGYGAFWRCTGLTSVTIGNSVTSFDINAFDGCSRLNAIYFLSITPPLTFAWTENPVLDENLFSTATLYVPQGAIDAYRSNFYWSKFNNIVEE